MQDFFLCPPRLESLFSPVLWKSCNQIPMAFKAIFPGGSQSLCQVPRLGSLMCSSEPSQYFFGILFSSLWVTHLAGMRFNFIVIAFLLPTCYSFLSLDVGFLFVVGFSILLSMVVQQLFAIWVLSLEMSTSPSTLPFSKMFYFLYIICVKSIINLLHTVLHS